MAMGPSTTTWDMTKFNEKIARSPMAIRIKVSQQLNRIGTLTVSELRGKMRRDTSNMVNHIEAIHSSPTTLSEVIVAGAKYTRAQDEGTRPYWPPSSALLASGWAKRHNKTEYSDKAFAFLVARAISKEGIKPMNVIKPTTEKKKAELVAMCKETVKGIW